MRTLYELSDQVDNSSSSSRSIKKKTMISVLNGKDICVKRPSLKIINVDSS